MREAAQRRLDHGDIGRPGRLRVVGPVHADERGLSDAPGRRRMRRDWRVGSATSYWSFRLGSRGRLSASGTPLARDAVPYSWNPSVR